MPSQMSTSILQKGRIRRPSHTKGVYPVVSPPRCAAASTAERPRAGGEEVGSGLGAEDALNEFGWLSREQLR